MKELFDHFCRKYLKLKQVPVKEKHCPLTNLEKKNNSNFAKLVANTVVYATSGNTKGGSITVPLTSCLTHLCYTVLQIKTKIVSCHTANSKRVKQEVNGTVILPPLVLPGCTDIVFLA